MDDYVKELVLKFQDDINQVEKQNLDIDTILAAIKKQIKEETAAYFETNDYEHKEKIKNDLIRNYNLMYYFQAKRNGIDNTYCLDDDMLLLPDIYLVDQVPERFEINNELFECINVSEGLTIDQATELLKWTTNNTRDNLTQSIKRRSSELGGVYDNASLFGFCGFAQFSSLYPLQKMGLKITINNVRELFGTRHAFGTVTIPIKTEDMIVDKRFLIDCSYRQFFSIPENVVARYLNTTPEVGFFVNMQQDEIEFAKELLKNGFVEADLENLKKYLKPFFSTSIKKEEISKIDEEFSKIDIINLLENKQVEFDFSEEEFFDKDYNLDLPKVKAIDL